MTLATRQELQELTGRRRPSAVAAHLRQLGVRYVLAADGSPRVAQAELDRLLGPAGARSGDPDFAALSDLS